MMMVSEKSPRKYSSRRIIQVTLTAAHNTHHSVIPLFLILFLIPFLISSRTKNNSAIRKKERNKVFIYITNCSIIPVTTSIPSVSIIP